MWGEIVAGMPDTRSHRGPAPKDKELFGEEAIPGLVRAVAHLSWLLTGGYGVPSSLKLVGDRFALTARQRTAVLRCACSDQAMTRRLATEASPRAIKGQRLLVDGYNLLTTIEAALGGGVILEGRDGCYRDMTSMHGSYRRVAETERAVGLILACADALGVRGCDWLLDRPVSNSGRLKRLLEEIAGRSRGDWDIELAADPDRLLVASRQVVVTADSAVLDRCEAWFALARHVVRHAIPGAWVVALRPAGTPVRPGEDGRDRGYAEA